MIYKLILFLGVQNMINDMVIKAIMGFITYLAKRAGVEYRYEDGVVIVRSDGKRGKDLVVAFDVDEFKELLGGSVHTGIQADDEATVISIGKKFTVKGE